LPLDDISFNFSFSGLKSAVINLKHNEEQRGNSINIENLATTFQNRVVEILVKKTLHALEEYNCQNLIVAGGVSANQGLRERLTIVCKEQGVNLTFPKFIHCTDNAAMIGAAGYYAYKLGRKADMTLTPKAVTELE
jgi:N6-L-threonylcarbamoyladenine synthase